MQLSLFDVQLYPRHNHCLYNITTICIPVPTPNKQTIRTRIQVKRQALSDAMRAQASQALCARIQQLPAYQNATHIALYQAIQGEIDLKPLCDLAARANKTCYMPVMNTTKKTLLFLPVTSNTPQQINAHHIAEPQLPHTEAMPPKQLDLMLVPLVAFDSHGTRLGRGAGYYDRTLADQKPACLLGVAYEFQHQPLLSPEPWDIPMDGIVTEQNIYWSAP